MKKTDYILIISLVTINTIALILAPTTNSLKANVVYENKIIMTIDLSKDGVYKVDAYNGLVELTVKDKLVAVTKETSPRHICAKQGFINVNKVPLICLPNKLVIEGDTSEVDGISQ